MRIAINAAIIEQGRLLIVKKRDVWILPGGKPNLGEDDETCLRREVAEELSGTRLKDIRYYWDFTGTTPHTRDTLTAKVYFAKIDGELGMPSAEIKESAWVTGGEALARYHMSDITARMVVRVRDTGYID